MTDDDCICDSLVDDPDPNCPVHAPKSLADHFAADIDTGGPDSIAEPGDMIKVHSHDRYHLVLRDNGYGLPVVDIPGQGEQAILIAAIEDVYTKAEQDANGALVHVFPGIQAGHDIHADLGDEWRGIWLDTKLSVFHEFYFLTPEAAAALGEFHPVPDRAIVAGDVVRVDDVSKIVGVFEGYSEILGAEVTSSDGKSHLIDPRANVSLVAPEDTAYREAKERGEDESTPYGRLIDAIRGLAADGDTFSGHELMEIISESDWLKEHDHEVRLYARQQPDPAPEWQVRALSAESRVRDLVAECTAVAAERDRLASELKARGLAHVVTRGSAV